MDVCTESPQFKHQIKAIDLYCTQKIKSHPETVVGLCGMGEIDTHVMLYPTRNLDYILARMYDVTIGGYLMLSEALNHASRVWVGCFKTELGAHLPKRIAVFAGGYVFFEDKSDMLTSGKEFNYWDVACDVISFGHTSKRKEELFETFIAAADKNGNCNLLHVPPKSSLYDTLYSSQLIPRVGGSCSAPLLALQDKKAASSYPQNDNPQNKFPPKQVSSKQSASLSKQRVVNHNRDKQMEKVNVTTSNPYAALKDDVADMEE